MSPHRAAAIAVVTVAAVAVVAGVMVAGSPAEQRNFKLDDRRIADLQSLARTLQRRHAHSGNLPSRLEDMVDGLILSAPPVDPVTDDIYEYEIVDEFRYRLCATFSAESRGSRQGFWAHGPGRQCFILDLST